LDPQAPSAIAVAASAATITGFLVMDDMKPSEPERVLNG
jgi:hypothetical protein